MVLDISENDELIPILGREWLIWISKTWFSGRPNGTQEHQKLIKLIETLSLNAAVNLNTEMVPIFPRICKCTYQGYQHLRPNPDVHVWTFYMPGETSTSLSKILITLTKRRDRHGIAK